MYEQDQLAFLTTLGETFCELLFPDQDDVVPQDGHEVFIRAFNQWPNPEMLATLTDLQFEQLRLECEEYLECESVTVGRLRLFVSRVLARWPVNTTQQGDELDSRTN